MRKLLLSAVALFALAGVLRAEDKVIYPRTPALPESAPVTRADSSNGMLLIFAVGAAGVGGWLLWRQRRAGAGLSGRETRKLAVSESRPLGNRQYLVVADYEGRKFLIGVCPGRIQMLAPLDGTGASK